MTTTITINADDGDNVTLPINSKVNFRSDGRITVQIDREAYLEQKRERLGLTTKEK